MKILMIFFILGTLFSCSRKIIIPEKASNFLDEYNNYFGRSLTEKAFVVKVDTKMGGNWIVIEDPTGENTHGRNHYRANFYAVNLDEYEEGKIEEIINPPFYEGDFSEPVFSPSQSYYGRLYLEEPAFFNLRRPGDHPILTGQDDYGYGSGHIFYIEGDLINGEIIHIQERGFESGKENIKDLEKIGSQQETTQINALEEKLIYYGLSSERSKILGKLLLYYNKITNKRELTPREKDLFTQELVGVTFDRATELLVENGYDSLIDKAAEVNGTDPETIKELIKEVF